MLNLFSHILHKTQKPHILAFRLIISNIVSASYSAVRYLARIFELLIPIHFTTVNNNFHFMELLMPLFLMRCTMLSFDVKFIFTNVSVEGHFFLLERQTHEFHYCDTELK